MRIKYVVLVHGASHGAWCWYKLVTMLQLKGFTVAAIDLTSMGKNKANPDSVSSVAEFAKPLLDYLENVTDKCCRLRRTYSMKLGSRINIRVLLVGHSLGGITVSYSMEQYPNKIGKAVFLVSNMPLSTQSFITNLPPNIPNTLPRDAKELKYANGRSNPPTSVRFSLKYVREMLYHDCSEEDVQLALSLLSPQPWVVYSEILTLTSEKYGTVPRFYILTNNDCVNPPSVQQLFIDINPPNQVFTIDSGHSPFFSRPSELTSILEEISKL